MCKISIEICDSLTRDGDSGRITDNTMQTTAAKMCWKEEY